MSQLFEQWFRIADADKDGAVGGAEAVSFFTRSGLPQSVLGQVWEMASGGAPKLNQFQFSSSMRLVALAQVNGGRLPVEQARAVVAGVGPALPPPTLQGLEVPGSAVPAARPGQPPAAAPAVAMSVPGAVPYIAQQTGPAAIPGSYAAQMTGGMAPQPQMPYSAQNTGAALPVTAAVPMAVPGGAAGAAVPRPGGAAPAYPPLPLPELQRFQATFTQLDTDRDGFLTGAECFGFFSQSGLEKAALRDMWNLVAGNAGRLSGHQFAAYLYLIDCCKRGLPLPQYLPPGLVGFPPVAGAAAAPAAAAPAPAAPVPGPLVAPAAPPAPVPPAAPAAPTAPVTWSLQSQFGTSTNINAVLKAPQVTQMAAPPPPQAIPHKLDLSSGERLAPPLQHTSHVPVVSPALLASVSAMDRTKLQDEQQVCEAKEKALQTVEERAAEARARQAQLTTALQELVVFRNRTEVALLTSQDQARRLEEEVEATRKRYEAGYAAAQAASEKSAAVHAHVMELMGQKTEMEEKMRRLEGEVAAAERMGPADVARLEGELAELGSKCTALEAARNAKMAKVDGIRKAQEAARAQLAALQDANRDVAAAVEGSQAALDDLDGKLKAARSTGSHTAVAPLLVRAAIVYRGLYGMAQRAGTLIPPDALPATLTGVHVWADEVAAGVLDWLDDDADARGFITVNALPGADAPRPIIKAALTSAPAPPPAGDAADASAKALPANGGGGGSGSLGSKPPPSEILPDDFASSVAAGAGFGDPQAFPNPASSLDAAFSGTPSLSDPIAPGPGPGPAAAVASSAPAQDPPTQTGFDFGSSDAPAFGSQGASVAPLAPGWPLAVHPPVAPRPAVEPLPEVGSLSQDDIAPGPDPASSIPVASQDSGPEFSFGHEGTSDAFGAKQEPALPSAAAIAARASFGFIAAGAGPSAAVSSFGGSAFSSDAPAALDLPAEPSLASEASSAAAPAVPAAAATTAGSFGGFDDNAFPSLAPQPTPPAQAEAAAPPIALDAFKSTSLEDNPFTTGFSPLPAFTSAAAPAPVATAPTAATSSVAEPAADGFGETAFGGSSGFEDSAFGAPVPPAPSSSSVPPAAAASAPSHPEAPAPGAPAQPSNPVAAAVGFADDNPFGDSDNPFGAPAFPQ